MPSRDPSRRRDRRFSQIDAHQVLRIQLYLQGSYVRTLPDSFSATSAAEFVRCYNHIGARSGRSAEIAEFKVGARE